MQCMTKAMPTVFPLSLRPQFGILLWELFCAGDPFQGVPRAHLGHAITKEARRPKFPPFAPAGFVRLATRCWDPDVSQRPTFEEVLSELVRMREELGGETPQLVLARPRRPSSTEQCNAANRGSPRVPQLQDQRSAARVGQQQFQSRSLDALSSFGAEPARGVSGGATAVTAAACSAAAIAAGGSLGGDRTGRFVSWANGAVSSPLPLHSAVLGASSSSAGSHSACELGQATVGEGKVAWVRRSLSDGGQGEESSDEAAHGEASHGSTSRAGPPPEALGAGSSLGLRPQGKGPQVQRRLRKMGIQLGGPAATSMTPTLPSLDEHGDEEAC